MKWSPSINLNPNFDDSIIAATKHINESKDHYGE
jgi:hypothetical protein